MEEVKGTRRFENHAPAALPRPNSDVAQGPAGSPKPTPMARLGVNASEALASPSM